MDSEELEYVSPLQQERAEAFEKWWHEKVKGPNLTRPQKEIIMARMKFPEDET